MCIVNILDANNNVLVTTTTDASGNYSVQLPGVLSNGTITLYAQAHDSRQQHRADERRPSS